MKHRFISIGAIASFIAQISLFFGAVTALTLLYLSYRYNDFLQSFIVIGMILIVPWLTISLLPTILALKDKELRKELLWGQLITMCVAFGILYGISISIDFDTVILARMKHYLIAAFTYCSSFVSQLSGLLHEAVAFGVSIYKENVEPLFS